MNLTNQKIVIFTAGFHARATYRFLLRQPKLRVIGFVDSNPARHGTRLFGLPVMNPAVLPEIDFDLVAVPGRNQAEICARLQFDLGVGEHRIWQVHKSEVRPLPEELDRRGRRLAELLCRTVNELDSAKVNYWAMHSALLGLIRGDDPVIFSDFDLCVDAKAFDALEPRFRRDFNLTTVDLDSIGLRPVDFPQARFAQLTVMSDVSAGIDEPAVIDMHPIAYEGARAIWPLTGRLLDASTDCFFPASTRSYRNVPVRVPAKPQEILARLYGAHWSTPAETWNGRYDSERRKPAVPPMQSLAPMS